MRLDHIAYRVRDRVKTADFFQKSMGYKVQTEFTIDFGNGDTAKCVALSPPEKQDYPHAALRWTYDGCIYWWDEKVREAMQQFHLPPEIFVSDGSPGSIVGSWVDARGVGGVHHLAYQVKSVSETMREWRDKGYAEFTSVEPFACPGLTQVFTRPSDLTGVIYEFIEREEFGFCSANVKSLMESTAGLDANIK